MKDKNADMQNIFSKLSERNKDIVILVAKSVKVAQTEYSKIEEDFNFEKT